MRCVYCQRSIRPDEREQIEKLRADVAALWRAWRIAAWIMNEPNLVGPLEEVEYCHVACRKRFDARQPPLIFGQL